MSIFRTDVSGKAEDLTDVIAGADGPAVCHHLLRKTSTGMQCPLKPSVSQLKSVMQLNGFMCGLEKNACLLAGDISKWRCYFWVEMSCFSGGVISEWRCHFSWEVLFLSGKRFYVIADNKECCQAHRCQVNCRTTNTLHQQSKELVFTWTPCT